MNRLSFTYTQLDMEKLRKFYCDPDWKLVEQMFLDFINPLVSVTNVDIRDNATAVKGEIRTRMHVYAQLKSWIDECRSIADGKPQTTGVNQYE